MRVSMAVAALALGLPLVWLGSQAQAAPKSGWTPKHAPSGGVSTARFERNKTDHHDGRHLNPGGRHGSRHHPHGRERDGDHKKGPEDE